MKSLPFDIEQHGERDKVLLGESCVVNQQARPERGCREDDHGHKSNATLALSSLNMFDNDLCSMSIFKSNGCIPLLKQAACYLCSRCYYHSDVVLA